MHANKREEIKEVYAGDIAAAVGLKSVTTGDTICDEKQPIVLESMDFPEPVISLAIEPKTKADQEKLGVGLQKLMAEDPTFRVQDRQQTGQVIIAGMGELHLEIIVDRLQARVQRRGERRQAAGRLQGNAHASGRRRDEVRQADRRPRPVRPREDSPRTRGEPGTGYVFENEIIGGVDSEGIHQADRRRASRKRSRAACSPAIRSTTCGSSCTTARTTTSTRRKWRSRSPGRWRSRTRRRRPSRCCSSR